MPAFPAMGMFMSIKAELKAEQCPLCTSPMAAAFAPFCSPRCKDRDLLNWLGEGYAIPATHGTEEDDQALANIGLDEGA